MVVSVWHDSSSVSVRTARLGDHVSCSTLIRRGLALLQAMSMQRKYVQFLSACAKTDASRYAKLLEARFGDDPVSKQTAHDALAHNVENIKKMLKAVKDVLIGCQKDMSAMQNALKAWRKDWKDDQVNAITRY